MVTIARIRRNHNATYRRTTRAVTTGSTALRSGPPASSPGLSGVLQQWVPFSGPPPFEMFDTKGQKRHVLRESGSNQFHLTIGASYPIARLHLFWDHEGTGLYLDQRIPLSYVPTAIAVDGSNNDFVIAGRTRSGQTLVERLKIGNPAVLGIVDHVTGEVTLTLHDAPILSVDRLYEGATDGLDYITSLSFYEGGWDDLLLQAWDSQDLWRLPAIPPARGLNTPELVASTVAAGSNVLLCPALDRHFELLTTYNHVNFGYLYHGDAVYVDLPSVIVWDLDRDGILDDWMEVPGSVAWESLGLHEPSGYLPWNEGESL